MNGELHADGPLAEVLLEAALRLADAEAPAAVAGALRGATAALSRSRRCGLVGLGGEPCTGGCGTTIAPGHRVLAQAAASPGPIRVEALPAGDPLAPVLPVLAAALRRDGRVLGTVVVPVPAGEPPAAAEYRRTLLGQLAALAARALARQQPGRGAGGVRVRAARLRALGEMAAAVAHDFNNVLSAILHRADALADPGAGGAQSAAAAIREAAQRGADVGRRLQDITLQRRDRDFAPVEVRDLIEDAVALWRTQAAGAPVAVAIEVDDRARRVLGEAAGLRQVLLALLANAAEAMDPAGGTVTVRARRGRHAVRFDVRDRGRGLDRR